jgi:branched-chain amino acid transport system ATP-binding protein
MTFSLASEGYVLELGRVLLKGSAKDLMHDENVKRAYLGGD